MWGKGEGTGVLQLKQAWTNIPTTVKNEVP